MHTIRVVDGKIEVGHYAPMSGYHQETLNDHWHEWFPLARCRSMEQACRLMAWINGGDQPSEYTISNIEFIEAPKRRQG